MAKYTVTRKNDQLIIKSRLERGESISDRELKLFSDRLYYGLMRPTSAGNRKIIYTAPDGISLEKYFTSGTPLKEFCLLIAQAAEATREVIRKECSLDNMLLDFKYVFVNSLTKKVHIIYQPLIGTKKKYDIFSFFYAMEPYVRPETETEGRVLREIMNSLRRIQYYHPDEVEKIVFRFYPDLQRQINRQGTGSGRMSGKTTDIDRSQDSGSFGVQRKADARENDFPEDDEERTGLLDEEEEPTGLLNEEEETGLLNEEEETGLLDEETGLLVEPPPEPILRAYIVKISNYDAIDVKKTPFLIGRERRSVDCFLGDNDKVSRKHVEIIREDRMFFLVDQNSKNGTFLNGMRVEPWQRYPLEEGSRFIIANEEFEFHVYET